MICDERHRGWVMRHRRRGSADRNERALTATARGSTAGDSVTVLPATQPARTGDREGGSTPPIPTGVHSRWTVPASPPRVEVFAPVSAGRLHTLIADRIRQAVRRGQLVPGDRLPAERDLCVRFGVSRVTVREALRTLEGIGLIDVRVGANGGAFVAAPALPAVVERIADLLALLPSHDADHHAEMRWIVETGLVPLACARATDQDIADLTDLLACSRRALHDDRDTPPSSMLSTEFHLRLARATGNRVVEVVLGSLLVSPSTHGDTSAPDRCATEPGIDEHTALLTAIAEHDGDRARQVMDRHLRPTRPPRGDLHHGR